MGDWFAIETLRRVLTEEGENGFAKAVQAQAQSKKEEKNREMRVSLHCRARGAKLERGEQTKWS